MLIFELKKFIEGEDSKLLCPDKSIFHYTSEQNYSEICRVGYLKLNSHLFLNTKGETNQELKAAACLIINQLKEDNELKNQVPRFELYISKGIIYYTLSFSLARSILIANEYGNYCIEFDAKLFKQFQRESRSTLFGNVMYDAKEQKAIIKQIFTIYKKWKNTEKEHLAILFLYLSIVMPLFKGVEHRNDQECRIIQAEIYDPDTGQLGTPLVTKKVPFFYREIINIYVSVRGKTSF